MFNKTATPSQKTSKAVVSNLGTIIKKILRQPKPLSPTNSPGPTSALLNAFRIGSLQRTLLRVVQESEPQTVFILANCNYKSYRNIGQIVRSTKRFVVILETGARSRFLALREILEAMKAKSRKLDDIPDVQNASGKSVPIVGTI